MFNELKRFCAFEFVKSSLKFSFNFHHNDLPRFPEATTPNMFVRAFNDGDYIINNLDLIFTVDIDHNLISSII